LKSGKFALKIFIILVLSLTLTAGYAQALPNLYEYGVLIGPRYTPVSISDLLSPDKFLIFGGNSWDFSKPDITSPQKIISKDEAITIAKGLWPGIILTKPIIARKVADTWTVSLVGYCEAAPGKERWPSGGIVKINARTGKIIDRRCIM
jgi:hypothetical protein